MAYSSFNPVVALGASSRLYKDIKLDFQAKGDGVSDDATAFQNFQTWAKSQTSPVYLGLPPGSYHISSGNGKWPCGIKNLTVSGYGATIDNFYPGSGPFDVAGQAFSARVTDTLAGQSNITLVTLSDYTKFAIGDWIAITNFDTQSSGWPPNPGIFEYQQVTGINSGTGVITVNLPLRNNYYAHYPQTGTIGNPATNDEGGPATIYKMFDGINGDTRQGPWDSDQKYYGITFNIAGQINGVCRKLTYVDCTFLGGSVSPNDNPAGASQAQKVTWIRCNMLDQLKQIEVDKMVEILEIDDCDIYKLVFQSASINKCEIKNSRIAILSGTPKRIILRNSYIGSMGIGSTTYGKTRNFQAYDTHIQQVGTLNTKGGVIAPSALSNSVITLPKPVNMVTTTTAHPFEPGIVCMFGNSTFGSLTSTPLGNANTWGSPFVVTDMTDDVTNIYVHTTIPAGQSLIGGSSNFNVAPNPLPNITVRGCTGDPNVVNWNHQEPGRPAFEYAKFTGYLSTSNLNAFFTVVWGTLVKMNINVIKAYSGVNGTQTLHALGTGGGNIIATDGITLSMWDPQINLKTVGLRTIVPGTTTGTQTGDANLTQNAVWITRGLSPSMNLDISGEAESVYPLVTIELFTDQGIAGSENIVAKSMTYSPQ